jgi:hypothetical protein
MMRHRTFFESAFVVIGVLLATGGCSTTYTVVEPSSDNPFTESQLTRNISGREVTVEFMDGKTARARDFRVEYDSCRWMDVNSDSMQVARSTDIKTIVTSDHVLGAIEGMGIGVVAVTGIAGANYLMSNVPRGGEGGGYGQAGYAVVVFYGAGGFLGATWGALSGHSNMNSSGSRDWILRQRVRTHCKLCISSRAARSLEGSSRSQIDQFEFSCSQKIFWLSRGIASTV